MAQTYAYLQYYPATAAGRDAKSSGITITSAQYPVNFASTYAQGVSFAYQKAGGVYASGVYYESTADNSFTSANIDSARAASLIVGFYFEKDPNLQPSGVVHCTTADASADAILFVNYVTAQMGALDFGDMFLALHFTPSPVTTITSIANVTAINYINTFVEQVSSYTSKMTMLYTNYAAVSALSATYVELNGMKDIPFWWNAPAPDLLGSSYPNVDFTAINALNRRFRGLCWSETLNIFCAVANYGTYYNAAISVDGCHWKLVPTPAANYNAVCWSPELELFCAVGGTDSVMTSPDGVVWTAQVGVSIGGYDITWSSELNLFCAVGSLNPHVATSPDGINWTSQNSAVDKIYYSIAWSKDLNLFCMTGVNSVETSPNGVDWTRRITSTSTWYGVCWSSELCLFCTVASNNTGSDVMISYNGIVWDTQTSVAGQYWRCVCWSPTLNLFCASADTGGVMTSPDGVTWTARTPPNALYWFRVVWSPVLKLFCMSCTNGIAAQFMTSPDGINWTFRMYKWECWEYNSTNTSAARLGLAGTSVPISIVDSAINLMTVPNQVASVSSLSRATTFTVTWSSSDSDVIKYDIIVDDTVRNTVGTGLTSATVTGATALTDYSVTVKAIDVWETSPESDPITVTTESKDDNYAFLTI